MQKIWKFLSIFLLAFALFGAILIPLQPSIYQVEILEKKEIFEDENSSLIFKTQIKTYNLRLQAPADVSIWLANSETQNQEKIGGLCADSIILKDAETIWAFFSIKNTLNINNYALFLSVHNDEENIVTAYPNAIILSEKDQNFLIKNKDNTKDFCSSLNKEHYEGKNFYFPFREQLYETIRNLFFHVPMWFVMMILSTISLIYSLFYLRKGKIEDDLIAEETIRLALFFTFLGLITGSIWAKFTWGSWWVFQDIKLNGAALTAFIYSAYLLLRSSIKEPELKGKLSAVYNIFAFVLMIFFLMILPRQLDSLHPGNGGNPAFNAYDLDQHLRIFFYPAVLGWVGLSLWILQIRLRIRNLESRHKIIQKSKS